MSVAFPDWLVSNPELSAARRANWESRHSDPAYIRLKQAIDQPLRGVPFIYLFAWEGDILKVGQTTDFYTRRRALMSNPLVRGVALEFEARWPTTDLLGSEQKLLDLCVTAGAARLKGREWFRLKLDDLCTAIEAMPAPS